MQILAADTTDLIEAACRLRYDVFVVEFGDRRYANDDLRQHKDKFDIPGDNIYVAVEDKTVVGTLRLIDRSNGPYIQDEMCGYSILAGKLGIPEQEIVNQLGFTTRGAIARSHRGKGLFSLLSTHLEDDARCRGLKYIIGVVAMHNDPSYGLLMKRGFEPYHEARFANGWSGTCICKAL